MESASAATLERLLDFYIREGGTSHAFWTTVPIETLRTLIADLTELGDAEAVEADFVDLGETTAFEVVSGEGECAS